MSRARLSAGTLRTLTSFAVIAALGLCTVMRVQLVEDIPDRGLFAKYTTLAQETLAGNLPVDRLGDVSTGYLGAVVFLSGPVGLDALGIRSLQIILVSLAACVCGLAAWRRWGVSAGAAAMGSILLSKGAFLNATEIEPETMILVLVSAALALVVAGEGLRSAGLAALLLGLAAVFRPSTILPAGLLAIGVIISASPRRRSRTAATYLIGTAIPLLVAKITIFSLAGFWPPTMNPGTVFFEGWNPAATGYLGEAPAVVKDVEHGLDLPDGLHVAYRIVAARATGREPSPPDANRYWAGLALTSIRHHPAAMLGLFCRKISYSLHSHDAWDLATMPRRSAALPRWPWIPFGFAAPLAALGFLWGRSFVVRWQLALFAAGCTAVMVLFYVTARQRNVVLPATALLIGLAVHEAVKRWRSGSRRPIALAAAAVAAVGTSLTVSWPAQREDVHTWNLRFAVEEAYAEAGAAAAAGLPSEREDALVRAAVHLDREALVTAPSALIEQRVYTEVSAGATPQRRFDLALVLIEIGRFEQAQALLEGLLSDGYRPRRGARVTSSVSFHLARCRLALGDRVNALTSALRALEEAPGEARPLALYSLMAGTLDPSRATSCERELEQTHDPFTAKLASARAWMDLGRPDLSVQMIAEVDAALEEGIESRRRSW